MTDETVKQDVMAAAQQKITRLRQGFLTRIPEMLGKARILLSRLNEDFQESDRKQLHLLLHSIHGSGASFGLNHIAILSAEGERLLTVDRLDETRLKELLRIVQRLEVLATEGLALQTKENQPLVKFHIPSQRPEEGRVRRENQLVYLCDDDHDMVELLATQLRCFGFNCRVFTNTGNFTDAVLKEPPCVVIMDVSFPDNAYGGPLAMSELKHRVGSAFPVLYLSCHSDFHARIKAIKSGCDGYYVKPASTTDLVQELHRLIQPTEKKPYQVLIIDDEPEVAEYNAEMLQAAGMDVHILPKPEYLLQVLNAHDIDIVLMDYHMPEFSGEELTRLIRQLPQHIGLPIAYLSSETSETARFGAMSIGAEDFILKQADPRALINAVTVRAERMRTLRARMSLDGLSGLYNHSTTTNFIKSAIADADYSGAKFSLVMIDLDRFKSINDTYGHVAGDQVIVGFSQLFSNCLRSNDIVGRYGGEEFVVIMPNTSQDEAALVMERLRKRYAQITFSVNRIQFHNTFSAGITSWRYGDTIETIRERADQALYTAKAEGRNCFSIAPPPESVI